MRRILAIIFLGLLLFPSGALLAASPPPVTAPSTAWW